MSLRKKPRTPYTERKERAEIPNALQLPSQQSTTAATNRTTLSAVLAIIQLTQCSIHDRIIRPQDMLTTAIRHGSGGGNRTMGGAIEDVALVRGGDVDGAGEVGLGEKRCRTSGRSSLCTAGDGVGDDGVVAELEGKDGDVVDGLAGWGGGGGDGDGCGAGRSR